MTAGVNAALIIGTTLVLAAFVFGGIYVGVPARTGQVAGGTTYVLNRFTGSIWVCNAVNCRELQNAAPPDLSGFGKPLSQ